MQNINDSQKKVMEFVILWVRTQKTPIPQREIIIAVEKEGLSKFTVVNALNVLIKKGYIRRAYTVPNKYFKISYVMLRGLSTL